MVIVLVPVLVHDLGLVMGMDIACTQYAHAFDYGYGRVITSYDFTLHVQRDRPYMETRDAAPRVCTRARETKDSALSGV